MKLTRLTLMALVLALMICAFAACGGDTPAVTEGGDVPSNTEATPATDAETEASTPAECRHTNTIEVTDEPTCEARGYKRTKCADCNVQISVKPMDAVDHEAVAPATCTEASVCKFCGTQMVAASGHTMGAITESKEATVTEAGYEKGACTTCGAEMTKVIPAGITIKFDDVAEGALSADAFAAFEGFEVSFATPEGFTIVADGDNKYIQKAESRSTITFTDLNGKLTQGKFAFSMDVRYDGDTGNSGLIAFKDAAGAEHRILSSWEGNKIRLGKDTGVNFAEDLTDWFNIRVVIDPSNFEYEIWLDGEKVYYTTYDADAATYTTYTLSDGEWTSKAASGNIISQGTIPTDHSIGISSLYLFHYSNNVMSIDNMRLEFFPAE